MSALINQLKCSSEIQNVLDSFSDCLPSLSKGADYRKEMAEKFSKYGIFLISLIDNNVCGFSAFYANDTASETAYLSMIAVNPKYQRNNIGSDLLNESISISKKLGMKYMKLEVRKNNTSAITFYKKNNFNDTDSHTSESIYMVKDL